MSARPRPLPAAARERARPAPPCARGVNHDGSLLEETGDLAIGSGDHIADSATETYCASSTGGSRRTPSTSSRRSTPRSGGSTTARTDLCRLRPPDRRGAARGRPVRDALHRRQARAGAAMSEPARTERPVGRRPHRLDGERAAAHLARRSGRSAAGLPSGSCSLVVAAAAIARRPADEAGRRANAGAR